MKKFLKKLVSVFETIGTARAAAQLSQMGYFEEAKALMLQNARAKQTYNELSKLSDKELRDIGISRGDIYTIAYNEKTAA